MQKKELVEQIRKLNLIIATSNKELENLELEYKKKKLEIKKYKNERVGLQLKLQEIELENNKNVISDSEIKRIQKRTIEKYCYDPNNEYYTQEYKKIPHFAWLSYVVFAKLFEVAHIACGYLLSIFIIYIFYIIVKFLAKEFFRLYLFSPHFW